MSAPFVSRKPIANDFNQQTLTAWQPKADLSTILNFYFLLSAMSMALGGYLYYESSQVQEYSILYDGVTTSNANCSISESNAGTECQLEFTFSSAVTGPIYVYYELTNYYQNHLVYDSSLSTKQLQGENLDYDAVYSDCYPLVGNGTTVLNPCGLIANTFFNDIFEVSSSTVDGITLDSSSISWKADEDARFQQVDGFTYAEVTDSSLNCTQVLGADYEDCSSYETGGLTYYYWYPDDDTVQYLYESYSSIVSPIEGVTNKHFMNWMRTAGVPEFRRLYGVFDTSVSAGDVIVFTVTNNFEVLTFGGSKSLVLTTLNAYGGQNYSIAYSYFAVGALALVVGIFLKWKRSVDPRPLGDIRVLSWK